MQIAEQRPLEEMDEDGSEKSGERGGERRDAVPGPRSPRSKGLDDDFACLASEHC